MLFRFDDPLLQEVLRQAHLICWLAAILLISWDATTQGRGAVWGESGKTSLVATSTQHKQCLQMMTDRSLTAYYIHYPNTQHASSQSIATSPHTHLSPGFPFHTCCSTAYCCSTVMSMPRLIVPRPECLHAESKHMN